MSDIKNFGCVVHCEKIVLPLIAKESGKHQLEIEHKGAKHFVPFTGVKGFKLKIPNEFNENKEALFKIIQPNGSYYKHTYADEIGIAGFDCKGIERFTLSVQPGFGSGQDNGIDEYIIDECNYIL